MILHPVPKHSKLKKFLSFLLVYFIGVIVVAEIVHASDTSTFNQTINSGTLSTDIVDTGSSHSSVGSPSITMGAVTFSFSSQNSSGTFGTSSEAIYVQNPDAADSGWTVDLAASSGTTSTWDDGGSNEFDFNDSSGATDGGDTDSVGGQMTVDPATSGSIAVGECASCTTTSVTAGSSDSYEEGTTDSITLMTGASGSDDIGDWTLQGVDIDQAIPAEQPAASYTIDMTLSVTAT